MIVIRFVSIIIIVGFDLIVAIVGDIVVGVIHVGFFVKVACWLKTKSKFDGR
jgi:hypothetical protein